MTGHPEAERADPIAGDVRAVRRDGRERYGAKKIKAALERKGVTASRRRIGSIMREQGMTSADERGRSEPHRTRVNEARLANLLDPRVRRLRVYGQINVYGVTTKSERHKRSYWTRTADGNGIGGRKAPVPYGS